MKFSDNIEIVNDSARVTKDGYLAIMGRIARGNNVQKYRGSEVGKPEMAVVDVFRPDSEVFSPEAMHSFAHRPLTNDHPPEEVTAGNWSKYAKGYTGDRIARDGDYIRVPLLMTDADTIKDADGGKREMSVGYSADIDWTPGVTPSGLHYDAIQRNIRANHVALVQNGRAGHEARIGDNGDPPTTAISHEGRKMADNRTVVVDGLTVETTQQGAEVINKLQGLLKDARTELADSQEAHEAELADKDKEIAVKDAKIAELEKAQMTDADLDKRVAERAELIAQAKAIKDGEYKGSPAEIRKAAVVAVLGDEAIKGKSEAYIDARFDILAEEANADPVRKSMADGRAKVDDSDPYGDAAWYANEKETAR